MVRKGVRHCGHVLRRPAHQTQTHGAVHRHGSAHPTLRSAHMHHSGKGALAQSPSAVETSTVCSASTSDWLLRGHGARRNLRSPIHLTTAKIDRWPPGDKDDTVVAHTGPGVDLGCGRRPLVAIGTRRVGSAHGSVDGRADGCALFFSTYLQWKKVTRFALT